MHSSIMYKGLTEFMILLLNNVINSMTTQNVCYLCDDKKESEINNVTNRMYRLSDHACVCVTVTLNTLCDTEH